MKPCQLFFSSFIVFNYLNLHASFAALPLQDGGNSIQVKSSLDVKTFPSQIMTSTTSQINNKDLLIRTQTSIALAAGAVLLWFANKSSFVAIMILISIAANRELITAFANRGIKLYSITIYAMCIVSHIYASYASTFHDIVFPISFIALVFNALIEDDHLPSLSSLSSSLLAIVYGSYLPSFWLRLKYANIQSNYQSMILPWLKYANIQPNYQSMIAPSALQSNSFLSSTYIMIATNDIAGYVIGKYFGKRKFSQYNGTSIKHISPNKSIEGSMAGLVSCVSIACIVSRQQQWPHWKFTGPLYGAIVSLLSLTGDLLASLLKRHMQIKDFGASLPGHGGVLDRMDSYILLGPVALVYFGLLHHYGEKQLV